MMRQSKSRLWLTLCATLGCVTAIGAARAQTPAPVIYGDGGSVITAPSQVAACLCDQQTLSQATEAMNAAHRDYDNAQRRSIALRQQADTLRPEVNPNDASALDAYRRLLRDSEAATAYFYNHATPDYDHAVKRYNAAVANYNAACAGRGIDPAVKAQVAANLFCPAPGL